MNKWKNILLCSPGLWHKVLAKFSDERYDIKKYYERLLKGSNYISLYSNCRTLTVSYHINYQNVKTSHIDRSEKEGEGRKSLKMECSFWPDNAGDFHMSSL